MTTFNLPIINTSPWALQRGSAGAVGYDLRANISEAVTLKPQAPAALIPTGIKIDMTALPGLAAFVYPRSGLGHKQGLVLGNGTGVIDTDYHGEIFVSAWNRNPPAQSHPLWPNDVVLNKFADITISPGDRIAQLVFVQTFSHLVKPYMVGTFDRETERGAGGFGSTGV